MRVCIYVRVSTSHHFQNPDLQLEELRTFCGLRNWTVVEEIVDHGFSGSSESRPGLKRLFQLARMRKVDAVLVLKLDRLFRSLRHLVCSLEEFQSLGVAFVAAKDNFDYTTPSGRLLVQVIGSIAEFERSLLRERTVLGLEHARRKGKRLGRPIKRNDSAIRDLRATGLSISQIQATLGVSRGAVTRSLAAASRA